jgi:Tfp pilus assembly protein PilO
MSAKTIALRRGQPRSWLITGLLAGGALAYLMFGFLPAQRSISRLRSQVNERQQHILQAQGLIGPLEQTAQQLARTRAVSDNWHESAPDHHELAGHMARLTAAARSASVALERFDPLPPVELATLSQHAVSVELSGEFAGIFEFLRQVEQLPGSVWVRDLRLTVQPDGSTVQGELTLTIFVDRSDSAD